MKEFQKDLVSVILPVYNSEYFLTDAIKSILNQTYSNLELIIIYDHSIDDSLDVIKKFLKLDSRTQIVNGRGKGLADALNLGIKKSKGEYLARMDADDISHQLRLEKQLNFLKNNDFDICGCHWININEAGKEISRNRSSLSKESILIDLCITAPFCHGSVLIKKSFLEKSNSLYRLNFITEDYDLWTRIYNEGARFGNIDDYLFSLRIRNDSLSASNKRIVSYHSRLIGNIFFDKNILKISEVFNNQCSRIKKLDIIEKERLAFTSLNLFLRKKNVYALRIFLLINPLMTLRVIIKLIYGYFLKVRFYFS